MTYLTKPIEEDGYVEVHLSLTDGLTPILKCRAVKNSDGKYLAVVRDFNTGILIDQSKTIFDNSDKALIHAVKEGVDFILACLG